MITFGQAIRLGAIVLFKGASGTDIVIVAYMGDLASGTIKLWYTGGGYGADPRSPGQAISSHTVSTSGATAEYVVPTALLESWLQRDGQLSFLADFLGNTVDASKWRAFVRVEQSGAALPAIEACAHLNGHAPPYGPVNCGRFDSGVTNVQAFTVALRP